MSVSESGAIPVSPDVEGRGGARFITAMPTQMSLRLLPKNRVADLPFTDRSRLQTFSGRVAIFQGVKALGLGEGDHVLLPAYACGSEVDAVVKAGCDPVYYPVLPDLSPDLEACRARLAETKTIKAFFVTHYFGFAQPIAEMRHFADQHGLALIEDCAHGFLSASPDGTPVGRTGDIAIFSYMKTLPLTDGGACVSNKTGLNVHDAQLRPPAISKLIGRFLFQLELSLKRNGAFAAKLFSTVVRGPARLLKSAIHMLKGKKKPMAPPAEGRRETLTPSEEMEVLALDPARINWSISKLASGTMARLDLDRIRDIRRRNYKRLVHAVGQIPGIRPLFDALPEGTCPLFCPIELEDAPEVQLDLARNGVGTKYFWSYFHDGFPREAFPFETALKTNVLVLPVHQDLEEADIDRVAAVLAKVMAERARK
ncbi:MAG: DegT/DnrJ/EryC1/StrS family aminotransferase [Pseudomonadota bacterium]